MTSLRNSPSLRQWRSSFVTDIPPLAGGGGYTMSLRDNTYHRADQEAKTAPQLGPQQARQSAEKHTCLSNAGTEEKMTLITKRQRPQPQITFNFPVTELMVNYTGLHITLKMKHGVTVVKLAIYLLYVRTADGKKMKILSGITQLRRDTRPLSLNETLNTA